MTKAALQIAVNEYVADPAAGLAFYGNISHWDVSRVTEMDYLFYVRPHASPMPHCAPAARCPNASSATCTCSRAAAQIYLQ